MGLDEMVAKWLASAVDVADAVVRFGANKMQIMAKM